MEEGLVQLIKLPFQGITHRIHSHPNLPYLLRLSDKNISNFNISQQKIVRQLPLTQQIDQISHISYCNKKLLYSTKNNLKINQAKIKIHNDDIKHLLVDATGLVLTAAQHVYDRSIKITETFDEKQPKIAAQFNFHYTPVTSLYWRNSLAISADSSGQACLWDINKCQTIFHRKIHYEQIRYIGTYTDYNANNIFYTVSPAEKRLIFSDLRTNKVIKILGNLHSDEIIQVSNTKSGKSSLFYYIVLITYSDIVELVDIYEEYKIIGNFSTVVVDKQMHMKWTAKNFSLNNIRKINQAKIIGKFLIIGCDNGCIEVYNTDTLECLYGFGLTKFGPMKNLEYNQASKTIFGLDSEGDVYMGKFKKQ